MWTCDSFADMGCRPPPRKSRSLRGLWPRLRDTASAGGARRVYMVTNGRKSRPSGLTVDSCGLSFRRASRCCCWRLVPALAGCGEGAPKQAAPPPPTVTVAKPHQADGRRLRRICRALRRGRLGRDPRARLRLSRQGAFQGRADRQAGRSAVHHRPPPVRDLARAGARDAGAGARQSRVHRKRSRPRLAAGARPHHHGADLRAAHAGQARRRGLGRGAGGRGAPGRARSAVHRAEGAGHRPDRRPARVAGQSRDRRHRRQHHAARHHRVDRSDPLRVHLR